MLDCCRWSRLRRSHHRRLGFTIVELLVTIAIIGILVSLLLPAVQMAREAARQVACRNNLKQLALASHNYQSTWRLLPGYAGEQNPGLVSFEYQQRDATMRGANWITKSLPYLEQSALAPRWEVLGAQPSSVFEPDVIEFASKPLSVLHCTTRRRPKAYPVVGTFADRFGAVAARTDYALNGGPAEVVGVWIHVNRDGVWRYGDSTKLADITDGTSNTYLIGEKAMSSNHYESGEDFGDRSPATGWVDNSTASNSFVRYAGRQPQRDVPDNCNACHEFGSAHPGLWNAAMADGSVRKVNYQLDLIVHRAFSSINNAD